MNAAAFLLPVVAGQVPTRAAAPASAPVTQPSLAREHQEAAAALVAAALAPRPGHDAPDVAALTHAPAAPSTSATRPAEAAVAAWLARNRDGVVGTRFPRAAHPVVQAHRYTVREAEDGQAATLYVHVLDHHASGKAIVYGVSADGLRRAYWLGDPKTDLKFETTPRDTIVELTAKNAKAPDPIATVVALEFGRPGYKLNPLEVAPRPDGSILLHAKEAVVVGRNLRYEPEPHKDTVGYWSNPADWVYWRFTVEKAGSFDVEMLQGCGKNNGGSEVEVTVDDGQPLSMTVQDTGHFQNFVPRVIGRVKLDPGGHTLAVKVKQKKGAAALDLRQVVLKPVP